MFGIAIICSILSATITGSIMKTAGTNDEFGKNVMSYGNQVCRGHFQGLNVSTSTPQIMIVECNK